MSYGGTWVHQAAGEVPGLVGAAVAAAARLGFGESCRPEHGRLLALLAGGVGDGVIGETGTGAGVGLAWLLIGAAPGARVVSVERDPGRAAAARAVVADCPNATVVVGHWTALYPYGPFDLLVLDGGGQGKGSEPPLEVADWVSPGGTIVMDDFTPSATWPPQYDGHPDTARMHWYDHPALHTTELRLTPTTATLVARHTPR